MEETYYRQLVKRYLEKRVSDDELEIFSHLLNEGKLDKYLAETMGNDDALSEPLPLDNEVQLPVTGKKRYWPGYAAAASILLCL
ncbi:MAG TPA: FecR family protein, partial [Mucilaginibacter sp.]